MYPAAEAPRPARRAGRFGVLGALMSVTATLLLVLAAMLASGHMDEATAAATATSSTATALAPIDLGADAAGAAADEVLIGVVSCVLGTLCGIGLALLVRFLRAGRPTPPTRAAPQHRAPASTATASRRPVMTLAQLSLSRT